MRKVITFALIAWLIPALALGAITIGDKSSGTTIDPGVNFDIAGQDVSGSDKFLYCELSFRDTDPPDNFASVTFDPAGANQSLTFRNGTEIGLVRVEVWTLTNPTNITNGTVRFSQSSDLVSTGAVAQCMLLNGVDQTTPYSGGTCTQSASATTLSLSVTSATGDLVLGSLVIRGDATSPAVGAGETDESGAGNYNSNNTVPDEGAWGRISSQAGAASVSLDPSWTGSVDAGLCGASIKAATAARRPIAPVIIE
jgi:hypothetical protein